MTKETIETIMKSNMIVNNQEAENALNFIRDLIDAEILYLIMNESYATETISQYREANHRIMSLLDELYK